MLLGKSLTVAERQKFLSKTTDYLHQQLGVIPEDYKRQELDRQNGVGMCLEHIFMQLYSSL